MPMLLLGVLVFVKVVLIEALNPFLDYILCLKLKYQKVLGLVSIFFGAVAQLGEHHVRNVGVGSSNLLCSTKFLR